jgi:hypothetical protein
MSLNSETIGSMRASKATQPCGLHQCLILVEAQSLILLRHRISAALDRRSKMIAPPPHERCSSKENKPNRFRHTALTMSRSSKSVAVRLRNVQIQRLSGELSH